MLMTLMKRITLHEVHDVHTPHLLLIKISIMYIYIKTKYFRNLKAVKTDRKITQNRRFELNFRTPHQYTHNGNEKR